MPAQTFSPELQLELAAALRDYARTRGARDAETRLRDAMSTVCERAHDGGMTPEAMVIALRRVYDDVADQHPPHEAQLRGAYDRLLSGCLEAYFEERQRRS